MLFVVDVDVMRDEWKKGNLMLLALVVCALLLWEKSLVNVGKNTSSRECGSTKKLVELFIVADGELDVARVDASLLVVPCSVAGKLKHLSTQILEDRGEVDRGTSSNSLSKVAIAKVAVDSSNWELQPSLERP